jgi:hypothetical protein
MYARLVIFFCIFVYASPIIREAQKQLGRGAQINRWTSFRQGSKCPEAVTAEWERRCLLPMGERQKMKVPLLMFSNLGV